MQMSRGRAGVLVVSPRPWINRATPAQWLVPERGGMRVVIGYAAHDAGETVTTEFSCGSFGRLWVRL